MNRFVFLMLCCLLSLVVWPNSARAARDCTGEEKAAILGSASTWKTVQVACNLTLSSTDKVTKQLVIEGSAADGITIDCNGAALDGSGTPAAGHSRIAIRSKRVAGADGKCVRDSTGRYCAMDRPVGITVRECKIYGRVDIGGGLFQVTDKDGNWLDDPSLGDPQVTYQSDYPDAARRNAPRDIHFEDVTIDNTNAEHQEVIYVYPGVRGFHLTGSTLRGFSNGVAVYLDRESYKHVFRNNTFRVDTEREIIAIDGSEGNQFINNSFVYTKHGGIYLYRNCGEPPPSVESNTPGTGVIRHKSPSGNVIVNNRFYNGDWLGNHPNVWIGSRNTLTHDYWCDTDLKADGTPWPWGSSASDYDHASYNIVMQNQIFNRDPSDLIKVGRPATDTHNVVYDNVKVTSAIDREAGCYLPTTVGPPLLLSGATRPVVEESDQTASCVIRGCTDGRLSNEGSCQMVTRELDCRVEGNNNGCQATALCPMAWNRPSVVIGARAACNLEYGTVEDSELDAVSLGRLSVVRESANPSDGYCYVENTCIIEGVEKILVPDHSMGVDYGCGEYDSNGGDCHVRGQLYCGW